MRMKATPMRCPGCASPPRQAPPAQRAERKTSHASRAEQRPAAGTERPRPDWRGWVALAWAVGWGWPYVMMVLHARAPRVLEWLSTVWK
jgi:hypothetical protein